MSLVTNVIVLPGAQEPDHPGPHKDHLRAQLSLEYQLLDPSPEEDGWAWGQSLREITRGQTLNGIPEGDWTRNQIMWGGSKVPECDVFAAAFNHLDWDRFKTWIENLPWLAPEQVRVLVMRDGHRAFEVWQFRSGALCCVTPGLPS